MLSYFLLSWQPECIWQATAPSDHRTKTAGLKYWEVEVEVEVEVTRQRSGLTCGPHRERGDQEEDQGVGLLSVEDGQPDQQEEAQQDQQGEKVAEHDPRLQTERLYDQIVEQHSYQRSQDVDQADVEDDGGAREDVLEEVDSCDEAVVRKEEADARHEQDNVDSIVLRWEVMNKTIFTFSTRCLSAICYLLSAISVIWSYLTFPHH